MQFAVSDEFRQRVVGAFGEHGKQWLDDLPSIVERCEKYWPLRLEQPIHTLSYNYVVPAERNDGTKVIVKVGCPNRELFTEVEALRTFSGNGAVPVLDMNAELGAFLLPYLEPGTTLKNVQEKDDRQATEIAADVMRRLHSNTSHSSNFPHVSDWVKTFEHVKESGTIPTQLLTTATELFHELDATKSEEKLLHGDLHHENILFDQQRGWLAIDPKGVIGDPAYETARFLHNPPGWTSAGDPLAAVKIRIDILASAMGFDAKRIAKWAFIDCLLSAAWTVEEGGSDWRSGVAAAEIFQTLF